jgi:hypothetical protein
MRGSLTGAAIPIVASIAALVGHGDLDTLDKLNQDRL